MDRKKFLAFTAILALIAGCCLVMVLYPLLKGENIFDPPPTAEEIGDAFLTALQQRDYELAFTFCDDALQQELRDPFNFEVQIMKYEIQPMKWDIVSVSQSGEDAKLSGSMSFVLHTSGSFELLLKKYDKEWKVSGFHMDHD